MTRTTDPSVAGHRHSAARPVGEVTRGRRRLCCCPSAAAYRHCKGQGPGKVAVCTECPNCPSLEAGTQPGSTRRVAPGHDAGLSDKWRRIATLPGPCCKGCLATAGDLCPLVYEAFVGSRPPSSCSLLTASPEVSDAYEGRYWHPAQQFGTAKVRGWWGNRQRMMRAPMERN
jgi:hypothetical protein